jgi:hypothetical protein
VSISEDSTKLIATIAALKLLLGRVYGLFLKSSNFTDEQIVQKHDGLLKNLSKQSLVSTSDLIRLDFI